MNHKTFSEQIWSQIHSAIAKTKGSPAVAVFDADGTLWETDMGENFFHEQIENKFLKTTVADPWAYYLNKKHQGQTREAYVWLAQILEGFSLNEVRDFAKQAFQKKMKSARASTREFIFQSQRELIEIFQKNKIEVFVVTASIKWAVEPGARALGIPTDRVLGIETEVENGIITDRGVFPITYREGKAARLIDACGKRPFFACGNTLGDLALLESATELPLAVRSHSSRDHLREAEDELHQIALSRQWLTHRF